MIRVRPELPPFLREAFENDAEGIRAAFELASVLPLKLEPLAANGRARLLEAVTPLPLRYAPFFERLSVLWDLPLAQVEALLGQAAVAETWRKTGLPGLRVVDVEPGPGLAGAQATLARFAPGMRFPAHKHAGPETMFVLEGSYRDASGRHVGPGDLHEMAGGSEHWFKVNRGCPCVAASVQSGFQFTGTLMRVLSRIFG